MQPLEKPVPGNYLPMQCNCNFIYDVMYPLIPVVTVFLSFVSTEAGNLHFILQYLASLLLFILIISVNNNCQYAQQFHKKKEKKLHLTVLARIIFNPTSYV